jgi:hypothetical protein
MVTGADQITVGVESSMMSWPASRTIREYGFVPWPAVPDAHPDGVTLYWEGKMPKFPSSVIFTTPPVAGRPEDDHIVKLPLFSVAVPYS